LLQSSLDLVGDPAVGLKGPDDIPARRRGIRSQVIGVAIFS
jgi:hypothetical protein